MKINIIEYAYDSEKKGVYVRDVGKGKVKYDPERDAFFVKYKNSRIPVKHQYIHNNTLSVVNYENSFIPIDIIEFKIVDVDTIGTIKEKLMGKEVPKQLEEAMKVKEKIKGRKEDPDPSKILKLCAMPMQVRSWYLLDLKRLIRKHMGFWEKYGNVVLFVLFLTFSIALVYIAMDQAKNQATALVQSGSKIFEKIRIFAVRNESVGFEPVGEIKTTTTTVPLLPP